jgi:hypothetical protein
MEETAQATCHRLELVQREEQDLSQQGSLRDRLMATLQVPCHVQGCVRCAKQHTHNSVHLHAAGDGCAATSTHCLPRIWLQNEVCSVTDERDAARQNAKDAEAKIASLQRDMQQAEQVTRGSRRHI